MQNIFKFPPGSPGLAAFSAVVLLGLVPGQANGNVAKAGGGKRMQSAISGAHPIANWISEHRSGAIGAAELQMRINGLGSEAWQEAFDGLNDGRIPIVVSDGKRSKQRGILTLAEAEREILMASFGSASISKLRTFLASQSKAGVDMSMRVTVLNVLEKHGNAKDLPSLVHWTLQKSKSGAGQSAGPANSSRKVPRHLREAFGSALSAILQRQPAEVSRAAPLYSREYLALAPQVASAIGCIPTASSSQLLVDLVGQIPEADSLLLRELAAVQETTQEPTPDEVRIKIGNILGLARGSDQVNAIIASGKLAAVDAIPILIGLLSDTNTNVSDHAHKALLQITKAQFRKDPERWRQRHQFETAWLDGTYPDLLHQALNGLPGSATRSLLEISKHRTFREALSRDILPCFDRPEQELVVLTCAVQGHLGSYHCIGGLKDLLHVDNTVPIRKAALDALKRITGENHGAERSAWDAAGW